MSLKSPSLKLSGDRFYVTYELDAGEREALRRAKEIAVEQTIEFPPDLLEDGDILEYIVGKVEEVHPLGQNHTAIKISYAWETASDELPQLLNVIYGNISMLPGIRVQDISLPDAASAVMPGALYGVEGLRDMHRAVERPLITTVLKPMGMDSASLAGMMGDMALGGVDIIKDDHGLLNQPFAPFRERVQRCCEALQRANARSGNHAVYYPNISGSPHLMLERAAFARECGAGGLLISPGLVGWDTVSWLRRNGLTQPVMFHFTLRGPFVLQQNGGFSHALQYGKLVRLCGADLSVFPTYGGRFSFTPADCQDAVKGCLGDFGAYRPIFPMPGGGMKLSRVEEFIRFYGKDCVLLVGGDVHRDGDLLSSVRRFRSAVEEVSAKIG